MKPFVIFVFVLIMVCFAGGGLARPQSAGQGKWSEKARLPEPRGEVAAASVNGKIYVMGGSARGRDDQQLVEEYAPATDRWRERAPMPRGISHAGAVGMNGKIYVVGGFTEIAGQVSGARRLVILGGQVRLAEAHARFRRGFGLRIFVEHRLKRRDRRRRLAAVEAHQADFHHGVGGHHRLDHGRGE